MRREDVADLTVFLAVAEEKNFTRAAAKLGMSQSALSQIVRRLEDRLGLQLLVRTTRSVAPTLAGEQLIKAMVPLFRDIGECLTDIVSFGDRPAGTIRITSVEHAARTILRPAIGKLIATNPDITVEVALDYGLIDIITEQFDAGVRLGGQVAKDMIAVRIGPDIPMAIVGAPPYFKRFEMPTKPQDLVEHRCINLRLPTSQTLYSWRVTQGGRETRVRVRGPLAVNSIDMMLEAALDGIGLAYLPFDLVQEHVRHRRLRQVLEGRTPSLPGYHIYYPSRRNASPAFRLFLEALRYRGTR